jgi:hypothetical protein
MLIHKDLLHPKKRRTLAGESTDPGRANAQREPVASPKGIDDPSPFSGLRLRISERPGAMRGVSRTAREAKWIGGTMETGRDEFLSTVAEQVETGTG